MSRYVVGIDLGTTNSALAFADSQDGEGDALAADPVAADPAGRRRGRRRRAAGPAVVPLSARRQGVPAGCARPPLVEGGRAGRRLVRPRPRGQGAGPARRLGQELALARRRRPQGADPAWDAAGRRGEGLARRGLDRLPGPPPRRLERHGRRQGRPTTGSEQQDVLLTVPASFDAVGPRADRRGRPRRRAGEGDPAGGAAGRVLRLAGRSQGDGWRKRSRSATCCSSATSAAARPTSP